MSIGLRDITQLEEILEASEGDKIIVIRNGEAKLMNGADIGGGGKVTNYYIGTDNQVKSASANYVLYADEYMTELVTVEDAYNALNSGIVYLVKDFTKNLALGYQAYYADEDDVPTGIKVCTYGGNFAIGAWAE